MVAGFYLSLDPPSSASVGLCLLYAAYDKTAWLAERGIDLSWPVAGLPETLHCDTCLQHQRSSGLSFEPSFQVSIPLDLAPANALRLFYHDICRSCRDADDTVIINRHEGACANVQP